MTQPNPSRTSVFSVSSVLSYSIATFLSAKEFAKLPTLIPQEKVLTESAELAIKVAAPLLSQKFVFAIPAIGSTVVTLLQMSFFVALFLVFFIRFYSHGEYLERHYLGSTVVEPRRQYFLRLVWVFIALNIPNLTSIFNSPDDAVRLVLWVLSSLLLMYAALWMWNFVCADEWIKGNPESRLNDASFRNFLKSFDGLPILVIALAIGLTIYFDTPAFGFLAVVAALSSCAFSVILQLTFYLSGILRKLFLTFIVFSIGGIFLLSAPGSRWLQSLL